jgi:hypothetical protein
LSSLVVYFAGVLTSSVRNYVGCQTSFNIIWFFWKEIFSKKNFLSILSVCLYQKERTTPNCILFKLNRK